MTPAWVLVTAWAALYVGAAIGGWWVGRDKVPRATFDAAVRVAHKSLDREVKLRGMVKASNRLLEQATKKRDPNAVDWSKIGV